MVSFAYVIDLDGNGALFSKAPLLEPGEQLICLQ